MDELETLVSTFTKANKSVDFSQNQIFYRQREYDYEKLSVSSLIFGSAGALTLILTLSGNSKSPDAFLSTLLPTLILFLLSLMCAGVSQFLLNEVSSIRFEEFNLKANKQRAKEAIGVFDSKNKIIQIASKFTPIVKHDAESTSDERYSIVQQYILCWKEAEKRTHTANKLDRYIAYLMCISALFFLIGISFPVLRLLFGIEFYGY